MNHTNHIISHEVTMQDGTICNVLVPPGKTLGRELDYMKVNRDSVVSVSYKDADLSYECEF